MTTEEKTDLVLIVINVCLIAVQCFKWGYQVRDNEQKSREAESLSHTFSR